MHSLAEHSVDFVLGTENGPKPYLHCHPNYAFQEDSSFICHIFKVIDYLNMTTFSVKIGPNIPFIRS